MATTRRRGKHWAASILYSWAVAAVLFISPPTRAAELAAASERPTLVIVVGAGGEDEFGQNFNQWAGLWEKAGRAGGANVITLGLEKNAESTDREALHKLLEKESKQPSAELWLALIGHGTFDGKEAKFNCAGPDLTASELATWLQPLRRPVAVINMASASGPFIGKLSAPGRVVIAATKSGYEQNYARFGQYLSEAITDTASDLDKDGQTSLLEAYLTAASRVVEFYKTEGRLATEHSLLDDNGDGLGTPADWFRGIRAVKKAKEGAALDGSRAHQFHLVRSEAERTLPAAVRAQRDELELAIAKMRESKSQLSEEEYYGQLEKLLLQMARLYERDGSPAP